MKMNWKPAWLNQHGLGLKMDLKESICVSGRPHRAFQKTDNYCGAREIEQHRSCMICFFSAKLYMCFKGGDIV